MHNSNIWNVNALIADLKNDSLSQEDKFKIFLIWIVLGLISVTLNQYAATEFNLIFTLFFFLFSIGICITLYRINAEGDNNQFIERYICLSVPILIRLYILWGLIWIGAIFVAIIVPTENQAQFPYNILWETLNYFGYIWLTLFYILMRRYFRKLAHLPGSPPI